MSSDSRASHRYKRVSCCSAGAVLFTSLFCQRLREHRMKSQITVLDTDRMLVIYHKQFSWRMLSLTEEREMMRKQRFVQKSCFHSSSGSLSWFSSITVFLVMKSVSSVTLGSVRPAHANSERLCCPPQKHRRTLSYPQLVFMILQIIFTKEDHSGARATG